MVASLLHEIQVIIYVHCGQRMLYDLLSLGYAYAKKNTLEMNLKECMNMNMYTSLHRLKVVQYSVPSDSQVTIGTKQKG